MVRESDLCDRSLRVAARPRAVTSLGTMPAQRRRIGRTRSKSVIHRPAMPRSRGLICDSRRGTTKHASWRATGPHDRHLADGAFRRGPVTALRVRHYPQSDRLRTVRRPLARALGVTSLRSSTPRAGAPISFSVIDSLSVIIGSHLHRPTVIPRGTDVSSMLAERASIALARWPRTTWVHPIGAGVCGVRIEPLGLLDGLRAGMSSLARWACRSPQNECAATRGLGKRGTSGPGRCRPLAACCFLAGTVSPISPTPGFVRHSA